MAQLAEKEILKFPLGRIGIARPGLEQQLILDEVNDILQEAISARGLLETTYGELNKATRNVKMVDASKLNELFSQFDVLEQSFGKLIKKLQRIATRTRDEKVGNLIKAQVSNIENLKDLSNRYKAVANDHLERLERP